MTNAVYPKYKEAVLGAAADSALTGTGTTGLYAVLVDTNSYTYNPAHQFYTSLTGIAGAEKEITSVTLVNGIVDGNDITFVAVPPGPNCEALVLFRKNTGASSTWRLVTYLDSGIVNLPVTPNGGDITITWNVGGIFGL